MPSKLNAGEILERARAGTEAAVAGRVFGAPIERDGVTVIPVAVISGGGGGGAGSGTAPYSGTANNPAVNNPAVNNPAVNNPAANDRTGDNPAGNDSPNGGTPQGEGSGGGFGFSARPAGVYVIRNGDAIWRPALDVNKIVAGGQLVAIIALLVTRSILRHRRR